MSPLLLMAGTLAIVAAPAAPAGASTYSDWEQLTPAASPPGRASDQMALDEATGEIVMYGGMNGQLDPTTGTWTWDGSTWTLRTTATNPGVRGWESLAWDPVSQKVLMFGGYSSSGDGNPQTWTWDGTDWTRLFPAHSPPGRAYGALAYDAATSQMVLFGGYSNSVGGVIRDTWTWTGTDWTNMNPVHTPQSNDHPAMAYDAAHDQLIVMNGGTWGWTGSDWADLAPADAPGDASSMAYDANAGRLIADTGGATWTWNGANWLQIETPTTPTPVINGSMAYSPSNLGVLTFGGYPGGPWTDETWLLSPHPASAPGAPLNVAATASGTRADVSFDPPSDDGHDPVTGYTVTASPGGATASGATSPISVAGLSHGQTYTFTVHATNSTGDSIESGSTNPVTIESLPTPPPTTPPAPHPSPPAFMVGGKLVTVIDGALVQLPNGAPTADTVVGGASTHSGDGAWSVSAHGGVFTSGDAPFFGSAAALTLKAPIVGVAALPDDRGYWLVASDGGIFSFGGAKFYGSTGDLHLKQPVVGVAPTPDGHGYWLVARDGGIFTFGDAAFFGSTGALVLDQPVVGVAPTQDGHGYWIVARDGGVFTFGTAQFFGSLGGKAGAPVVGMTTGAHTGYSIVRADGTVSNFNVT
ncbi:MAG: Esterase [Actinomycetia bacterium]|nr:Esterase [Actinomycetes bacterium]